MGAEEDQKEVEISELDQKIIQQVEYYFGDYNLIKDKFLKEKRKLDDGWVLLDVLLTFNRLKSLSEDPAVIAGALKKSTNDIIEISEDETKIRRRLDKPVPEFNPEIKTEICNRTVYAKLFPSSSTLDELLKFFRGFGNVDSIFMKKKPNKTFKGSVFATFATKEEAESFLKLSTVKFNNADLMRESKESYLKRKETEYQERKVAKDKKQKQNDSNDKSAEKDTPAEKSEENPFEKDLRKGCILKLSGLSETTSREDLDEIFGSTGDIAYLDYSRGKPEAYIRYAESVAQEVLVKHCKEEDGCKKIAVKGTDALATVLEGEVETEYLQKIVERKSNARNRSHFKRGRGRFNPKAGGGRDKHWGKKRGRQENGRSEGRDGAVESKEPPKKVQKTDNDSSG